MQHGIKWPIDIDVVGHIVLHKPKAFVTKQMTNIVGTARNQVVHGNDGVPLGQKAFAQM